MCLCEIKSTYGHCLICWQNFLRVTQLIFELLRDILQQLHNLLDDLHLHHTGGSSAETFSPPEAHLCRSENKDAVALSAAPCGHPAGTGGRTPSNLVSADSNPVCTRTRTCTYLDECCSKYELNTRLQREVKSGGMSWSRGEIFYFFFFFFSLELDIFNSAGKTGN